MLTETQLREITWHTKAWGREKELARFNRERNDYTRTRWKRNAAEQAHLVIAKQLEDKTYTGLRERLINASRAGDQVAIAKIELLIRDYNGEPKFAASVHKDY